MWKLVGIVLILLGVLGLVYGGFTYTKETHDAKLGPLKLEMKEKDRFEVPIWLSVVCVGAGAGALLWGGRRK